MSAGLNAASAGWSASLPLFKACVPNTPPDLPERWRATALMMPFHQGQLDIGDFVYDGSVPAMRATVYGLESGAVDILITESDTFLLDGPHDSPTHCSSLGPKLRPPSARWVASDAVCVGEAPVAKHAMQWWQKSGFDAARFWFSADTHLPWRTSFVSRLLDPAIIGDYAMSYFPAFTPLDETNLPHLREFCAAKAKPVQGSHVPETPTARDLMAFGNKAAEAERQSRIGELVPTLSLGACSHMTPARWPDRFVSTAMVTPIQINQYPYSALFYYDWAQAKSMTVLPFHNNPPVLQGIISLQDRVGYRLRFSPVNKTPGVCASDLPGVVRPDWMSVASCKCRGVIKSGSPLSPDTDTQILSCPIKMQGQRVMWSWYTTSGQPVLFMEAAPEGGGVMLADYDDWLPGQTGQASDLELPKACLTSANTTQPGGSGGTFSNPSCSACHTTPW